MRNRRVGRSSSVLLWWSLALPAAANNLPYGWINSPPNSTVVAGQALNFEAGARDPDGDALSYRWSFGDPAIGTRTVLNPGSITFLNAGKYRVSLVVTDARGGVDPSPPFRYITVQPKPGTVPPAPPPPAANAAPESWIKSPSRNGVTITAGQAVVFAANGRDADGDALSYQWTFEEPAIGVRQGQNLGGVTFADAGEYRVFLQVTDSRGAVDPTPPSRRIVVLPPNNPPEATILSPANTKIALGASLNFSGMATDPEGEAMTYRWIFSDPSMPVLTTLNPGAVRFNKPGEHRVSLQVTDARGAMDLTPPSVKIIVQNDDPVDWAGVLGNLQGSLYTVASQSEFNAAALVARSGDVIRVRNGVYADWKLEIPSLGTPTKPIVYMAETPGGVTFTGRTRLYITGSHNLVGGFVFRDCGAHAVQISEGDHNRLTDTQFIACRAPGSEERIIEITQAATRNRIDHNRIIDSGSVAVGVYIGKYSAAAWPVPTHTRIDHNIFQDSQALSIQVGPYTGPDKLTVPDTFTEIENNEFNDAREQIINSKTGRETIRFNRFIRGRWEGISLRLGNNKTIEGNYFEDMRIPIHVYGTGHKIYNNIMIRSTEAAILMPAWGKYFHTQGRPLSDSPPTGNNLIAHNTIVQNALYGIEIGRPWGSGAPWATNPPFGNQFINNIITSSTGTLFRVRSEQGSVIKNNLIYPSSPAAKIGEYPFASNESGFVQDPLLDAELKPTVSSPVIGRAELLPQVPVDRNNISRASGNGPDIGAYEFLPH